MELILSLILTLSLINLSSSSSYTALVFKGCADQNLQDSYKQTLKALLSSLTTQSSAAKFNKTTIGDGASTALTGLFQCRGDLSTGNCNTCVRTASSMAGKLCGQAVAVRVQLTGCHLSYKVAEFGQASGTEFLYKVCRSTRASGTEFGERLDSALGEVVKGVGGGWYVGGHEGVYVLGQCEGEISGGDCVKCVKSAVERAKLECGSSVSAQIYLQDCYIGYTYYPNRVPTNHQSFASSGRESNTKKTIAIVMGGFVGGGSIVACLLFAKSAFFKKKSLSYIDREKTNFEI